MIGLLVVLVAVVNLWLRLVFASSLHKFSGRVLDGLEGRPYKPVHRVRFSAAQIHAVGVGWQSVDCISPDYCCYFRTIVWGQVPVYLLLGCPDWRREISMNFCLITPIRYSPRIYMNLCLLSPSRYDNRYANVWVDSRSGSSWVPKVAKSSCAARREEFPRFWSESRGAYSYDTGESGITEAGSRECSICQATRLFL